MWQTLSSLLNNSPVLLSVIISLGILIGKIKVFNFSLDSAGILFVALLFGHFGFLLPSDFLTLGMMFFLYSVGMEAGPTFFHSFRKEGVRLSMGAALIVLSGMTITLIYSWIANIPADTAAGMFAGSLTSTPGLAVAVELTSASKAPAAYGLTYSFGILGLVLFIKLGSKILQSKITSATKQLEQEEKENYPPIHYHHIQLSNPNLFGVQIKNTGLAKIAPVVISRLLRKGSSTAMVVSGETELLKGDLLRIVGTEKNVSKAELYLGKRTRKKIEFSGNLINRKILISKKNFFGHPLQSLNLAETFNVRVTRITRENVQVAPRPNFILRMGDALHILGTPESVENVTRLLGNDAHQIQTTNVFSTFLGIMLGVLLGKVSVPFPLIGSLQLGLSGGVLLAGILAGYFARTGPILWEIPWSGKHFLREAGLSLFLAVVGTSSGAHFMETIESEGLSLFMGGILVTLFTIIFAWIILRKFLHINPIRALGVLSGGMTSTPGLAAATSVSDHPQLGMAYAGVYPVALVMMIISMKILLFLLLLIKL